MSGGPPTKVTPAVEAAVLEAAQTITTAGGIADAVNAKHGFDISRRTAARILERTRGERADIAKNIVREVLTPQVQGDLDILRRHRDHLDAMAEALAGPARAGDSSAQGEYRKTVAALTAVVDKRLHYSGADTPDAPSDELKAATQRLHGRLDRLASARGASGTAEGDSPDQGR